MSRNLVRDEVEVRVYGDHAQRLGHVSKLVDGEWVYVGTYPSGSGTTPDSPVFKNGWQAVSSDPFRFRWLLNGSPDFRGKFTGGANDTVVCTLPVKARPDNEYVLPYAGTSNCVGSLTIEADGDVVWHPACGTGASGTLEEVMASITGLVGWWRLGENPNEADLLTDDFWFANSAQGFANRPMIADYSSSAGLSLFGHGAGSVSLTASDDKALFSPGVAANRLIAQGDYGTYFSGTNNWTIACWFMPGYDDTFPAPSIVGVGGRSFVCGNLRTDGGGSFNEGVGFVWRPHYADPDQSGPLLQLWRVSGSESTVLGVPINTNGVKSLTWWESNGYRTSRNPGIALPEAIPVPTVEDDFDPWFHVAATYDGTVLRAYINGLLAASTPSTHTLPTTLIFRALSAQFKSGISEYEGKLQGAVDEVAVWSKALNGGEILSVAQAT